MKGPVAFALDLNDGETIEDAIEKALILSTSTSIVITKELVMHSIKAVSLTFSPILLSASKIRLKTKKSSH